jgi:hypothetical protein
MLDRSSQSGAANQVRLKNNNNAFFVRLHWLQDLYCAGKIAKGSPEHFEILALEELESLVLKQEMQKLYGLQLTLSDRMHRNPACFN